MKKLLLLLMLASSTAYAVDVTQVEGPTDVFGGGAGCTTDCTFDSISSGGLTAGTIGATTGVFTNLTVVESITAAGSQFTVTSAGVATGKQLIISGGLLQLGGAGNRIETLSNNRTITLLNSDFTAPNSGVRIFGDLTDITNSTGTFNGLELVPRYGQSGDAGRTTFFLNVSSVSDGSGEKNLIKADVDTVTKFKVSEEGEVTITGQKVAFRVLSSTSETITGADHTIFCLPNDNAVTLNFPTAIQSGSSSIYEVFYDDSGSTNKCYLEGNGSEDFNGFTTYSGLDTYLESVRIQSNGVNWRILGGR